MTREKLDTMGPGGGLSRQGIEQARECLDLKWDHPELKTKEDLMNWKKADTSILFNSDECDGV